MLAVANRKWIIESETVRYGVRYTRGDKVDALIDGGWLCRVNAELYADALLDGTAGLFRLNDDAKATEARVVKITRRWIRRVKKVKS